MTLTLNDTFTIRPATLRDAAHLVNFAVMASKGLSLITWNELKEDGETALEVGLRRVREGAGGFSYHKAEMAERDGNVVSAVVSYSITPDCPTDTSDVPVLFRPLVVLEDRAGPSWYINILATYEEARRQGAATALIRHVEARAKQTGQTRLSLIVDAANPATRLYAHLGFEEMSREPFARTKDSDPEGSWVLMIKRID